MAMAKSTSPNWRLISWNVNGIRAIAQKGFHEIVGDLKPDILCLQETKAQDDQVEKALAALKAEGYHLFSSSAERKGYSGTAVLTRHEPKHTAYRLNGRPDFDTEGRHIRLDFTAPWGDFTLFNVYFPNGGSGPERLQFKLDYYECFQSVVEKLKAEGRHIVVCGDVNTAHQEIDLARPKENRKVSGFMPIECAWVDRFLAAGFIDSFRAQNPDTRDAYTWWDMKSGARARNVGWRIDYFLVTQELGMKIQKAEILPSIMGSDHCPIELTLG
jgi:exodeoxyribonuclease III